MIANNLRKMVVATVFLSFALAGYVRADKLALQEKLGEEIKIRLSDVTIAEALEKIGQKAGVKFVLSDEAAWKLPYGEATRLSVVLDGPLADSMTEMLNAFFMRYAVGDKEVTVYPRPELEHILGRPTTKQLELLKAIYTSPMEVYYIDQEQKTINEALGHEILVLPIYVQAQVNKLLRQLVGQSRVYERDRRGQRSVIKEVRQGESDQPEQTEFRLPTPVTLVQLLSQVKSDERNDPRDTRWYISGLDFASQIPEVRVVASHTLRELRLKQKVDFSYKDETLDKIFGDLAGRAGLKLIVGRSSYLNENKLSVNMQNITIEQAILNIADMVGAACEISREIEIRGPGKPEAPLPGRTSTDKPRPTKAKADSDDYVGKISIPMDGGKYFIEFMLRKSDLTEKLRNLRQEKMKEILGESSGAKPAPAPASPK